MYDTMEAIISEDHCNQLPSYLRNTEAGARILHISEQIGWTPNARAIESTWGRGAQVTADDKKLRKKLRKVSGQTCSSKPAQQPSKKPRPVALDENGRPLMTDAQVRQRLGISQKIYQDWWDKGRIYPAKGIFNETKKPPKTAPRKRPVFSEQDIEIWIRQLPEWSRIDSEEKAAEKARQIERRNRVRESLHLDAPEKTYPAARAMSRRIVFHAGPTNSGKTHAALQELAKARSGTYAAPLRLLAMEGYDRLCDLRVAAGLLTGEEEVDTAEATHISCTIETMSTSRVVDVLVIDEVQLLSDPERGAAWTRALLGAPAREIHLAGSPEALPWIQKLLSQTGETVEVVDYERQSQLIGLEAPVREIKDGDAIVVFSRREVMRMRAQIRSAGHEVAVIFGALPPEVRRREAERFSTGEAGVLVATDAIGMGLNLPIQRVIFGELAKFDGYQRRILTPREIRQIGGRAGRGADNPGYVGVLPGQFPQTVTNALRERDDEEAQAPVIRFRPELLSAMPARAGWGEYLLDIRSHRHVLPKSWHLDASPQLDVAADLADEHERASGERVPFCFTAPIDDDVEGPATQALAIGLLDLRKSGTWSIPRTPKDIPETDAQLTKWTNHGKALTVARWFCRHDSGNHIDRDSAEREWALYIAGMMSAMESAGVFQRSCPDCGTALPWSHRHRYCDTCFFDDDLW